MSVLIKYFKNLWTERKIICDLALNDCKARFASSGLGIIWAFLQPLLTLLVFWFVFQIGFKNPPIENTVFIIWFAPAYLIWTFFSETLFQVTNSLVEYQYLIKKVNFRVNIIPPIKIVSNSMIHLALMIVVCFMCLVYKYGISLYALQAIYYFACTCVLLLGVGWIFSALNVFAKDIYNVIGVVVQIGFWITPIFWNPDEMNAVVQFCLKLNPMYYICTGYREAFIYKIWFWQHPLQTIYFWGIVIVMLVIGSNTFEKLYKLFDDAL